MARYRYYLLDALNEYRSGLKLSRWLPPYGATALLVGRHHFMTFDKQFYDFAGECSYLLTSDFVNSKFSAIVNYEIHVSTVPASFSIRWKHTSGLGHLWNTLLAIGTNRVFQPNWKEEEQNDTASGGGAFPLQPPAPPLAVSFYYHCTTPHF